MDQHLFAFPAPRATDHPLDVFRPFKNHPLSKVSAEMQEKAQTQWENFPGAYSFVMFRENTSARNETLRSTTDYPVYRTQSPLPVPSPPVQSMRPVLPNTWCMGMGRFTWAFSRFADGLKNRISCGLETLANYSWFEQRLWMNATEYASWLLNSLSRILQFATYEGKTHD